MRVKKQPKAAPRGNSGVGFKATKSPKKLSPDDYECPICLLIMIEPVTLSCSHDLCLRCFEGFTSKTGSTCPLCRASIPFTWARHARQTNTLVNKTKWEFIQRNFPQSVKDAMGLVVDESEIDEAESISPVQALSEAGAIRKEYEQELRKLNEERRIKDEEEEAQSSALLKAFKSQTFHCFIPGGYLSPMESEALWLKRKEEEEATLRLIEQLQLEDKN